MDHITAAETATWLRLEGEPFDELAGPFEYRLDGDGSVSCRFRPQHRNTNGLGIVHGGSLLTFADYCLFVSAKNLIGDDRTVTVSISADFVGMVRPGSTVEARCDVVKSGRSLIFLRGLITSSGDPVMSFSGVMKRGSAKADG